MSVCCLLVLRFYVDIQMRFKALGDNSMEWVVWSFGFPGLKEVLKQNGLSEIRIARQFIQPQESLTAEKTTSDCPLMWELMSDESHLCKIFILFYAHILSWLIFQKGVS